MHRDGQGVRHVVAAVRAGEVVVLAVGDVQRGPLDGQLPRVGGGIVVRRDRDAVIPVPLAQVEATPVDIAGDDERGGGDPPLRGDPELLGVLGKFGFPRPDPRIQLQAVELPEELLPGLFPFLGVSWQPQESPPSCSSASAGLGWQLQ